MIFQGSLDDLHLQDAYYIHFHVYSDPLPVLTGFFGLLMILFPGRVMRLVPYKTTND